MKTFFLILFLLISGSGGYLYYDKDLRSDVLNEVDRLSKRINESSSGLIGKPPEPIKFNRKIEINLKREEKEIENLNTPYSELAEASIDEKTVHDEKEVKATKENQENKTKSGENNTGKLSPYIDSVLGQASIAKGQPDRIIINGNIIRFAGVSIINYQKSEQELEIIAANRSVNCGVVKYSSNKIPYAICFVVDENNNAKININYHLIKKGLASYIKN